LAADGWTELIKQLQQDWLLGALQLPMTLTLPFLNPHFCGRHTHRQLKHVRDTGQQVGPAVKNNRTNQQLSCRQIGLNPNTMSTISRVSPCVTGDIVGRNLNSCLMQLDIQ